MKLQTLREARLSSTQALPVLNLAKLVGEMDLERALHRFRQWDELEEIDPALIDLIDNYKEARDKIEDRLAKYRGAATKYVSRKKVHPEYKEFM